MGTVNGPSSSVVGNVVLWNDTTGTTVSDSGETLSLQGLSNVTYQTGGSPSNLIIGQQVTLASGATENVFIGELAGATAANSTSGTSYNTAVGYKTLSALAYGEKNTAIGCTALVNMYSGNENVAIGYNTMIGSGNASYNIAVGNGALSTCTDGETNVALGVDALDVVTSGSSNVGVGHEAGQTVVAGSNNILIGYQADVPSDTSNYLNIGYAIFGTGMTGQTANPHTPAGSIGIGVITPANKLSVSPLQYSTGTASQSGTTVTGVGTTWTSAMVGSQFIYANGVSSGTITAVGSTTSLTVATSQTVASQNYMINYTGLQVNSTGLVGIGTTSPAVSLDLSKQTDALALPVGTTTQRPTGANGEIRYNSTNNALEAYINGAWANLSTGSGGGRTLLTANTNFYVATTGSDSNAGTSGSPWLTIQHAINYIQQNYDLGGYTATVNVANGTYTGNVAFNAPFVGAGTFSLLGNATTPANCIIAPSSGNVIVAQNGAQVTLGGFNIQVPGTNANVGILTLGTGTVINVTSPMYFGGSHTAYGQIYAAVSSNINITANLTFAAAAGYNMIAKNQGLITANSITMTLSGSPTLGTAYYFVTDGALIDVESVTYTGSGTIPYKYQVIANGLIQTNGAASSIPGTSTLVATQGQCL